MEVGKIRTPNPSSFHYSNSERKGLSKEFSDHITLQEIRYESRNSPKQRAQHLHSSFKWPQRWQGTWPLHLILRLLHSLLANQGVSGHPMEKVST